MDEEFVAHTEIVIGGDRVHIAPRYYPELGGYWPHFMLQQYWAVSGKKLLAITEVIDVIYETIDGESWQSPIVCTAAATALFLDYWNGHQQFIRDADQAP